jgi:glutamate synthase domain-containing protein 1
MCGIVGLFIKTPALERQLGENLAAMLVEMSHRGPDSAGFAVYRPAGNGDKGKLTLFHSDDAFSWAGLADEMAAALGMRVTAEKRASHAVLTVAAEPAAARAWLRQHHREVRVMGVGESIEIYKEMGAPAAVAQRFGLSAMTGSHAIGHTRMATESAVTTEHSHPFVAGLDLCLVHNGSLSNHNRLRSWLQRRGVEFDTDNDSEVAAAYFAWRMQEGATLDEALEAGLKDIDGFYTFAVGTRDGFAVVRDGIACKHAVLAETDDWVAMATEYRAIAVLPGADRASIWEPAPANVYHWSRSAQA